MLASCDADGRRPVDVEWRHVGTQGLARWRLLLAIGVAVGVGGVVDGMVTDGPRR